MRALDRKKQQDEQWEAQARRWDRKAEQADRARADFLQHCQPATLLEYTAWMMGYLRSGGEPSHVYDYEFNRPGMVLNGNIGPDKAELTVSESKSDWWVLAEIPATPMPSLYGSSSLHIIVPAGLGYLPSSVPRTFHGQCGHSTVYFMHGFTSVGSWIPVFTDMLPMLAADL